MSEHILIVDDEAGIRETLSSILEDEGYRVTTVESGTMARRTVAGQPFDVMILDIWLPDADGLELLSEFQDSGFGGPIIMISGHGNIESAVKSIRLGAFDFLEKPLSLSRVVLTVSHALQRGRLEREVQSLTDQLGPDELIGDSPPMTELKEQIETAAQADSRILIAGENGTGKELVARRIHELSPRSRGPFVDVNCAAIPEELIESELFGHVKGAFTGATANRTGRFEQANGGTLFLDEIADMSLKTQAKVLRVLQEQKFEPVGSTRTIQVDVRVLAATNKDLQHEIAEGRFREDLFFRLAVIPLEVPSLRERRGDIQALLDHFLAHFALDLRKSKKEIERPALEALEDYAWPGNVRELRNLAERLMIMTRGDQITVRDLPSAIRGTSSERLSMNTLDGFSGDLKEARDAFETRYIEKVLKEHKGNVSRTAQALGIERSSLHRKIKSLGIEVERSDDD